MLVPFIITLIIGQIYMVSLSLKKNSNDRFFRALTILLMETVVFLVLVGAQTVSYSFMKMLG